MDIFSSNYLSALKQCIICVFASSSRVSGPPEPLGSGSAPNLIIFIVQRYDS